MHILGVFGLKNWVYGKEYPLFKIPPFIVRLGHFPHVCLTYWQIWILYHLSISLVYWQAKQIHYLRSILNIYGIIIIVKAWRRQKYIVRSYWVHPIRFLTFPFRAWCGECGCLLGEVRQNKNGMQPCFLKLTFMLPSHRSLVDYPCFEKFVANANYINCVLKSLNTS